MLSDFQYSPGEQVQARCGALSLSEACQLLCAMLMPTRFARVFQRATVVTAKWRPLDHHALFCVCHCCVEFIGFCVARLRYRSVCAIVDDNSPRPHAFVAVCVSFHAEYAGIRTSVSHICCVIYTI